MQESKISTTLASSRQQMPPRPSFSPINLTNSLISQEKIRTNSMSVSSNTILRRTRQTNKLKDAMLKLMQRRRNFKLIMTTLSRSRKKQKQSTKNCQQTISPKLKRLSKMSTTSLSMNIPKVWSWVWKHSLDYLETAIRQLQSM